MERDDFYRRLYDDKSEYVSRRDDESLEARLIQLEVERFKIPNLLAVIPGDFVYQTVLEVGCATGELIARFPAPPAARKIGLDISVENVRCARRRHPHVEFSEVDVDAFSEPADLVILSDVLEHVPDDRRLLRRAAEIGRLVLINLPLENNWLNARRQYGPDDVSGHLRRYSLDDGLELLRAAGLECPGWRRVWVHETAFEAERRRTRSEFSGSAFSGGPVARVAKGCAWALASAIRPVGRRVFASNLFASARLRSSA